MLTLARYVSADEDSGRWLGFTFRPGDIVVSTRSKHGTTWVQAITAMLVVGSPELPAPIGELSPWLDFLGEPLDVVTTRLATQEHRRVIKTHTPLDGVPRADGVTYLVVARHPLDAAVSLWHQGRNLHRPDGRGPDRRDLGVWLRRWIAADPDPREHLDSLPGVFHHLTDAWSRRSDPAVVLLHYSDLLRDLEGQVRTLAARLHLDAPPGLVDAASFERMRARADTFAPDSGGVLKGRPAFFRRGSSGAAEEVLSAEDLAAYWRRAAELGQAAGSDFVAWLHHGSDRDAVDR